MAVVIPGPPALSGELALFHTTDPLLGNSPVLVFHGPASTIGATSSRIQVHVFTPAGLGSYSRLSVSPNSPYYTAVSNLPREEQGDEVCRGLAFGLKRYFSELSDGVKKTWSVQAKAPSLEALFGDHHIAILATRMARVENIDSVILDLSDAFSEQRLSWLDIDVVLPSGTIRQRPDSAGSEEIDDRQLLQQQYGRYAELIATFGEVAFLPTSRLKRAPSRATSIGRHVSFTKHQKENVRKELTELVITEESYVARLGELQSLREKFATDSNADMQGQLEEVFPPLIGRILEMNTNFLRELRCVVVSTAVAAEEDIENSEGNGPKAVATSDPTSDAQGVFALARCLCEWFPQFADCYKAYMEIHAQASQTIRKLLRDGNTLAAGLQDIGEQKLTSLLIEPVQRLPRYNLYIDSISKQLPARYPGLKSLLKARDLITEICAEREGSEAAVLERLRSRTFGWPTEIRLTGRLITVADFVDLMPPYNLEACDGPRGLLLLFTDGIIILEKPDHCKIQARTLITELETGSLLTRSPEGSTDNAEDLRFVRRLHLDAVKCTESHEGQALRLLSFFELGVGALAVQEPVLDSCQILRLENAYDGRASRFVEEFSKARVEGRFSEAERESVRWELRATDSASDSLGLFGAIFEDTYDEHAKLRGHNAAVRVLVDAERHAKRPKPGQDGIRTVISLTPGRDGLWRVYSDSVEVALGDEHLELSDILPAMRRKFATIVSSRLSIERGSMSACLLSSNLQALQSMELQTASQEEESRIPLMAPPERVHRPRSPKKLLSNFLSSVGPGSDQQNVSRKEPRDLPALTAHSSLSRVPTKAPQKPPSRESRPSSRDQTAVSFSSISSEPPLSPSNRLEDTLSAYILALQARKGNIVGKNLKMRVVADELMVNELYNSLLEDPNMMVLAAQAPLDVLFGAFDKFVNAAWKESVGSVVPISALQEIQSKAESLFPADFDRYFKTALGRFTPQNQRAFRAIMKLLADLLDGTGNDGDRGILTSCFAEVLITEANPHDYIALIDRFVEDTDTYFGEPVEEQRDTGRSTSPHKRARSLNASSITSNTSSIRRKFGFSTLSRENSKSEQESKVASVWRSLSKPSRTDASPHSSISKASLSASQSFNDGHNLHSRPVSQDGSQPRGFGELPSMPALGRAPSSHNLGLSTIGEHPSFIPTGPPRKKRRSSLSDLKPLESTPKREPVSPSPSRHAPLSHNKKGAKELPNLSPPSTPSSKGNSARSRTPQTSPRSRLPSSFRQELSPNPRKSFGAELQRPKISHEMSDEVVITATPVSNIPSLMPKPSSPNKKLPSTPGRTGLSERPGAGNIVKKSSPQPDKTSRIKATPDSAITPSTPGPLIPHRKLRMQSPQKLRERLHSEQSSVAGAQNALQNELSKIGDELTSSSSIRSPTRGTKTSSTRDSRASDMDLAQRVLKMEGQLPKDIEELNSRINSIQSDLTSSLSVSEMKCKKLDELYREANAENEALYTRFNDELARVMKAVKGGEGVEEMRKKLKDSQDEAAKLKREASRLKRENAGLRAQLKG